MYQKRVRPQPIQARPMTDDVIEISTNIVADGPSFDKQLHAHLLEQSKTQSTTERYQQLRRPESLMELNSPRQSTLLTETKSNNEGPKKRSRQRKSGDKKTPYQRPVKIKELLKSNNIILM